ncbi:Hpt domain-containing protein, partial [Acinetobacter baumannii]
APREIESLQDAAGQRNVERIACAAHGLKGVCGTVFAHQMKITCGDLEAAALERCWEQVDLLVSRLTSELYEVSQFVTKQVQQ